MPSPSTHWGMTESHHLQRNWRTSSRNLLCHPLSSLCLFKLLFPPRAQRHRHHNSIWTRQLQFSLSSFHFTFLFLFTSSHLLPLSPSCGTSDWWVPAQTLWGHVWAVSSTWPAVKDRQRWRSLTAFSCCGCAVDTSAETIEVRGGFSSANLISHLLFTFSPLTTSSSFKGDEMCRAPYTASWGQHGGDWISAGLCQLRDDLNTIRANGLFSSNLCSLDVHLHIKVRVGKRGRKGVQRSKKRRNRMTKRRREGKKRQVKKKGIEEEVIEINKMKNKECQSRWECGIRWTTCLLGSVWSQHILWQRHWWTSAWGAANRKQKQTFFLLFFTLSLS